MNRALAVAHVVTTALLCFLLGVCMFFPACETVSRTDGTPGIALGPVLTWDDEEGMPVLSTWGWELGGGLIAAGLGLGGLAVRRRRRSAPAAITARPRASKGKGTRR